VVNWLTVHIGDNRDILPTLPAESVHCVVTSPPYWGLRDYGAPEQLGLEPTPEEYVANLVAVFRDVRRVLRDDGTVWLNLGDSYAADGRGTGGNRVETSPKQRTNHGSYFRDAVRAVRHGLKPKDLVGVPWRVAFALQADGWYLRSDIIWSKPNPMPESVTDRPTKSHEYVFLLAKSARYYFDQEAVREASIGQNEHDLTGPGYKAPGQTPQTGSRVRNVGGRSDGFTRMPGGASEWAENGRPGRNIRSVWSIATQPYPGAHFAVFPEALVEPCVKAGCPEGGTVLDPFAGSGTVGLVANRLSRRAVLIDLNPDYLGQIERRNLQAPLGLVG
jgi:DNA modification methylase